MFKHVVCRRSDVLAVSSSSYLPRFKNEQTKRQPENATSSRALRAFPFNAFALLRFRSRSHSGGCHFRFLHICFDGAGHLCAPNRTSQTELKERPLTSIYLLVFMLILLRRFVRTIISCTKSSRQIIHVYIFKWMLQINTELNWTARPNLATANSTSIDAIRAPPFDLLASRKKSTQRAGDTNKQWKDSPTRCLTSHKNICHQSKYL